ncbi:MAG: hypothetical protein WC435_01780 [Candidatus Paceibacterota bacterium]
MDKLCLVIFPKKSGEQAKLVDIGFFRKPKNISFSPRKTEEHFPKGSVLIKNPPA